MSKPEQAQTQGEAPWPMLGNPSFAAVKPPNSRCRRRLGALADIADLQIADINEFRRNLNAAIDTGFQLPFRLPHHFETSTDQSNQKLVAARGDTSQLGVGSGTSRGIPRL